MKLTALRFARIVDDVFGEPLRAAGFAPEPATCTWDRSARQVWRGGERFVEFEAWPQMRMDPPMVGLTLGIGPSEKAFTPRDAVGLGVLRGWSDEPTPRLPDASVGTVHRELSASRADLLTLGADCLRGDLDAFRARMQEAWADWMAMRAARGLDALYSAQSES